MPTTRTWLIASGLTLLALGLTGLGIDSFARHSSAAWRLRREIETLGASLPDRQERFTDEGTLMNVLSFYGNCREIGLWMMEAQAERGRLRLALPDLSAEQREIALWDAGIVEHITADMPSMWSACSWVGPADMPPWVVGEQEQMIAAELAALRP